MAQLSAVGHRASHQGRETLGGEPETDGIRLARFAGTALEGLDDLSLNAGGDPIPPGECALAKVGLL
ncbi:MAG: hypothetical protein ACE5GC_07265 [Acidimicrobiia bacterium]